MAQFFNELASSIFTPGPTPTLIVATNVSFACLQLLLGVLFVATRSIHFFILSFLSGGLWWAINWFANELQQAKLKEEEADRLRRARRRQEHPGSSGDDTETEGKGGSVGKSTGGDVREKPAADAPQTQQSQGGLRRRENMEASGELSTEDEWEKVSEEGGKDR